MGTLQPGVPYTDPDPDDVTEQVSDDRDATEIDATTLVVGPGSATDDAVALFDGTTGKLLQDSATTIAQIRDRTLMTGGGAASLRHTKALAVPNNAWTTVPWNTADEADNGMGVIDTTTSTTIAAGSNGAALPQATINVVSTAGFPASGFITIEGPPGASTLTIVSYSGVTATSFTGCAIGTGTMSTGQTVRPANHAISLPTAGRYLVTVQFGWAANATGRRGVKLKLAGFVDYGIQEVPTTNTASQGVSTSFLLKATVATTVWVQVIQTSGGVLNTVSDGLTLPTVTAVWLRSVT